MSKAVRELVKISWRLLETNVIHPREYCGTRALFADAIAAVEAELKQQNNDIEGTR